MFFSPDQPAGDSVDSDVSVEATPATTDITTKKVNETKEGSEVSGESKDSTEPQDSGTMSFTPTGGESINIGYQDALGLMQLGYSQLQKDKEPKQEVDSTELTDSEKLSKAEADIIQLRKERTDEKNLAQINNELITSSAKYPEMQELRFARSIQVEVLARHQLNPTLPITNIMAEVVKERLELEKERFEKLHGQEIANRAVSQNMIPGIISESGNVVIDREKKFTTDDWKSGAARAAMVKILEQKEG